MNEKVFCVPYRPLHEDHYYEGRPAVPIAPGVPTPINGFFVDAATWEKIQRLAFPCKNLDCDNGKINHFIWRCLECGREYEGLFPNFTPECQCGARDAEYLRNDEVDCTDCNGAGIDEKKLDKFLKGGEG